MGADPRGGGSTVGLRPCTHTGPNAHAPTGRGPLREMGT
ncbi:hypothetical protein MBELCI_1136 [Limimaricola cinnabarinus LL-001]|uniref:Uncharacterized protein n=1 Tax=Limimaricola cinnabarinus LL-001 TaxID=1337093 RepID=U3ABN7_9RHOB|nr:hypothetical protein MBELCI_1136 [Limimaricola cinnabarinus LL-001]